MRLDHLGSLTIEIGRLMRVTHTHTCTHTHAQVAESYGVWVTIINLPMCSLHHKVQGSYTINIDDVYPFYKYIKLSILNLYTPFLSYRLPSFPFPLAIQAVRHVPLLHSPQHFLPLLPCAPSLVQLFSHLIFIILFFSLVSIPSCTTCHPLLCLPPLPPVHLSRLGLSLVCPTRRNFLVHSLLLHPLFHSTGSVWKTSQAPRLGASSPLQ